MELKEALEKADRIRRSDNAGYTGNWIRELLEPILSELDKPKVWDGAPEWATDARIRWTDRNGVTGHNDMYSQLYTRTLPKSPAREIAEKYSCDTETCHPMINGRRAVDVIESAINEYKEREK